MSAFDALYHERLKELRQPKKTHSERTKAAFAHRNLEAEQREAAKAFQPAPMPGRLADGTRVWLHYEPLRWERHP